MTRITGMLRSELYKVLRRRMTLILGALLVGITVLLYVAFTIAITGSNAADMDSQAIQDLERMVAIESLPAFADDIVWQLVCVMAIILMASAVGSEFTWRTVLTVTTWTGDRVRPLLARFSIITILAAIGTVVGFVTAFASSVVLGMLRGTLDTDRIDGTLMADIGVAVATTWYTAMPYILLAAFLAMFGRGAALGIALGLAVLFLEGLGVLVIDSLGESFAWLKHLTMNWNVQAVLNANGFVPGISTPPDPDLPSAWRGAAMLLLFSAGYVVGTVLLFVRRDLTE